MSSTSFKGFHYREPVQQRSTQDDDPGGVSELYSAPVFLATPHDLRVNEGETVRLECRPSGRPIPDIQWFLDGKRVFDDRQHKMVINEDGIHSLILNSIGATDGGTYTCIAKNRGGEAKFDVRLSVLRKQFFHIVHVVYRV